MKKITYFFAAGITALSFGLTSCAEDEVVLRFFCPLCF